MSTQEIRLASGVEVIKSQEGAIDTESLAADAVDDSKIDFGTGTGQVNLDDVPIGVNIFPVYYSVLATVDNIAYTSAAPVDELYNGLAIIAKMPNAATGGNMTLNVNSLGAKKVFRVSDMTTQLTTGDLLANGIYIAVYNTSLDTAAGGWIVYDTPSTSSFATLNTSQTFTAAKQFAAPTNFAETAGTAPVYTLAVPITALVDGAFVAFKVHSSSTDDDATLNVNSLGAKPLAKQSDKSQITDANALKATVVYTAYYSDDAIADGAWVVQGI